MVEREVKIRFDSPDAARAAVLAAGAAPLRPRRLQDDALFDSQDQVLRAKHCALRIRSESGQSLITFKGPVQPGTMKIREELETMLGDAGVLRRVFEELGLRAWFRYQKYREEFSARDAVVAIDETPVGTFVEIEGSEEAILALTAALGRSPADFILDSYYALFMKHRDTAGLQGTDMIFPQE